MKTKNEYVFLCFFCGGLGGGWAESVNPPELQEVQANLGLCCLYLSRSLFTHNISHITHYWSYL